MAVPTTEFYKVSVKPRGISPYRRGWAWDAAAEKWNRVWISNFTTVYVKRDGDGKIIARRLSPAPGYSSLVTLEERRQIVSWAQRRLWRIRFSDVIKVVTYSNLSGDVDCKPELLRALNAAAREDGNVWHIASGNRTYAEQEVLWKRYLAGLGALAARPGESNHHGGSAADVHVNGQNVGASHRRRTILRNHGLCLPVAGEQWHVERGATWRA